MIMVGFFTAEATTAKTHPESVFGEVLVGWTLGRSLLEGRGSNVRKIKKDILQNKRPSSRKGSQNPNCIHKPSFNTNMAF